MRLVIAALVLVLAGCSFTPPVAPLGFTAFQSQGSNPAVMDASARSITVLAIDGLNFLPERAGVTPVEPSALALLEHAHASGIRAELMVGNFDNALGDFSPELAHDTLGSPTAITAAIIELDQIVETQGWDGVNIDVEALDGQDVDGLSLFARELADALGPDKTVSIALPLKNSADDYLAAGFNLESLDESIDRFILMAYDEHGPWEDVPGPIGSLDWQRAGIETLLESVPADKVELGVAGYGYGWGPSGEGQVSIARAEQLAPDATFDEDAGEWTAKLADGTELWWSDIRSFRLRVGLAREYVLAGVALWSLEQGDPIRPADLR